MLPDDEIKISPSSLARRVGSCSSDRVVSDGIDVRSTAVDPRSKSRLTLQNLTAKIMIHSNQWVNFICERPGIIRKGPSKCRKEIYS